MALSQMYPGLMVVPWFNSYEWKYVKNCIISNDDGKKEEGLNVLKMWKNRNSKLPSAVEGTLMLLTALLKDSKIKSLKRRFRCYCYGLLRFLNICCGQHDKQGTFYRAAKKNNFPDWIVDFRHALAHGQALPGILEIHDALVTCLNWIINEYWIKQSETLKDYIIEDTQILNRYCNTVFDRRLYKDAATLTDIELTDNSLQQTIRTCQQNYALDFGESIEDADALLDTLTSILNGFKSETTIDNFAKIVGKYLCSEQLDIDNIEAIPIELEVAWRNLLNSFFSGKILLALIWELLRSTNSSKFHDSTDSSIKLASLWLKYIFDRLLSIKDHTAANIDMAEESELIDPGIEHLHEIISETQHIEAFAISCCNIYTFLYLPSLLKLCGCSETYIQSRIKDVDHQVNDKFTNCEKHTPSKLNGVYEDNFLMHIPVDNLDDTSVLIAEDTSSVKALLIEKTNTCVPKSIEYTINEPTFSKTESRCKLLKDTSMFENCPLGVLPFQPRNCNPLIFSMNY